MLYFFKVIFTHTHTHTHTSLSLYIYIILKNKIVNYLYVTLKVILNTKILLFGYIYIYIYIYTHTHTHTHIYIYIYIYIYELISDVLLWTPTHGRAKAGRPARTYIQQLCEDTGCCPEDLPEAMNDREKWRERVRDIRATST